MIFVLDNYDSFTYNLVQYMGELGAGLPGTDLLVRRNDELTPAQVEALHPSRILISPGPCTPQDAGISIALIQHFARLAQSGGPRVPILGVCLGHQAIGAAFGGNVVRAPRLMHGKTSQVTHDGRTIFSGIPSTTTCTRYHSLIVSEEGLPAELEVSARTPTLLPDEEAPSSGPAPEPPSRPSKDLSSRPSRKLSFRPKEAPRASAAEKPATPTPEPSATTIMALRHRTLPIEGVQFHPESVLTTHGKQIIANFLAM